MYPFSRTKSHREKSGQNFFWTHPKYKHSLTLPFKKCCLNVSVCLYVWSWVHFLSLRISSYTSCVHLSVSIYVHLLFLCQFVHLYVCSFIVLMFICLSLCMSIYTFYVICLSLSMFIYSSFVYLSISTYVHLYFLCPFYYCCRFKLFSF